MRSRGPGRNRWQKPLRGGFDSAATKPPCRRFSFFAVFFFVVILNEAKDLHFCPPPIVSLGGSRAKRVL